MINVLCGHHMLIKYLACIKQKMKCQKTHLEDVVLIPQNRLSKLNVNLCGIDGERDWRCFVDEQMKSRPVCGHLTHAGNGIHNRIGIQHYKYVKAILQFLGDYFLYKLSVYTNVDPMLQMQTHINNKQNKH